MISETKKRRTSARSRSTNLLLLALLPLAVFTGLVANTAGTRWGIHPSVFHGIAAIAVLILSPWKQVIVRRGLGRRRKTSWISIALLFLVISTLTTGIMHAFGYQGRIGPLTFDAGPCRRSPHRSRPRLLPLPVAPRSLHPIR